MNRSLSRRDFLRASAFSATALALRPALATAPDPEAFSFLLLGDLHFDRLEHHDLEALGREKPDDLRQVREYSQLRAEILPKLFATVRDTITELNRSRDTRVAFTIQVGDLVEGLCGNEERARHQDCEVVDFVRAAELGAPFLFTKGNHDVTGPGAVEAFNAVFPLFLEEQLGQVNPGGQLAGARYTVEHANALFCFFDAYDKESLGWLEAVLARRTAKHCFVIVHPPAVPYGARSTWHLFSNDREKSQRKRLLDLLGQQNAFVLSGHIHKYNMLARTTPRGGKFLQLGISSVIPAPDIQAQHVLSGVGSYNGDQVSVEPAFSPSTEKQRRAVYLAEAPFVRQFQYADLPGYAVVSVKGAKVTAKVYSGITRQPWRSLDLTDLLCG